MTSYPRVTRNITLDRCDKFTSKDFFSDVNLYSNLYKKRTDSENFIKLQVYKVPQLLRITFEEAIRGNYEPAKRGDSFGPNWKGEEVQFLWNANNEGMIWTVDGTPLQGLTGGGGNDRRVEYILTHQSNGGESFEFYLEMACNGMFGNGLNGLINPPDPNKYFTLEQVEIAIPNKKAWQLLYDFQIILDIAKELPHD
ncbi:551_t:CDS:2, partial [Diversispora eburnea]